ncbi:TRAP transporter small permease [Rhodovibrio salinarum]|nr:TRAP transporter small permease [Rhodovibrio salinarum]
MRTFLDRLYALSGAIAAAFICAIALVVLAQVGANLLDQLASLVLGAPFGLVVPSYANFAGFFLTAATFFALAYTLKRGAHIRVTLAIQFLGPKARQVVEVWCILVGLSIAGFFTWHTFGLVSDSYRFGDMSTGMVAIPIWIPQGALVLGGGVLTIALLDELVVALSGRTPAHERANVGILEHVGEAERESDRAAAQGERR